MGGVGNGSPAPPHIPGGGSAGPPPTLTSVRLMSPVIVPDALSTTAFSILIGIAAIVIDLSVVVGCLLRFLRGCFITV